MDFCHPIQVRWADCDPARIAYTGNIPGFALEAIDAWWGYTVGADWYRLNMDHNVGTPFVHMSLDFRSPITPRHVLECRVEPLRLGTSSIRFKVIGFQNDIVCFEGEFVEVFVEADSFQKTGVPEIFREKITKVFNR